MRPVKTRDCGGVARRTRRCLRWSRPTHRSSPVERSVVPVLPAIEVIALSSERVDTGPMARHELSCEITVASATEDGCGRAARCHRAGRPQPA